MRTKAELLGDALKTCADQYANYSTRYAALDGKAQGTAVIAGVLLGAVLAFVPQAMFRAIIAFYGRPGAYPVAAVLAFCLMGIILSICSLQVRPGRIPYRGEVVAQGVLDLLALTNEERSDDFIERHYVQQLRDWQGTLDEMAQTINIKSSALRLAQFVIAGSGGGVAIFVVLGLHVIA